MQTTFKLFLVCLFCLVLSFTSGCDLAQPQNRDREQLVDLDVPLQEEAPLQSEPQPDSKPEQQPLIEQPVVNIGHPKSNPIQQTVVKQSVRPLIQTKWGGHDPPFTNMLPMDGNKRCAVGCEAVAVAQIMKFHNHPARGIGQSEPYTTKTREFNIPSVNFEIDYDWDNMLNTYPSANSGTTRQRNAVATLMHHVAVSLNGDFTATATRTGYTPRALIDFFGYDKSMQVHVREYHSDESWEALLREQIGVGLPVFYFAKNQTDTFQHVFIMDGCDNTGKFHFNMGYRGWLDGYFALNDMPQNMNGHQTIIINIKPDEGSVGSNEWALVHFSTEKNSVPQNEIFGVNVQLRSISYFTGGQEGIALVDNGGNISAVIGTRNARMRHPGGTTAINVIKCSVPDTIKAGKYQLRIVTRPNGGEWEIVRMSEVGNGVPNSIDFVVVGNH